jgi:hypothetical protein
MSVAGNNNALAVVAVIFSRTHLVRWVACAIFTLALSFLTIAGPPRGRKSQADSGLIAHEWGTFTMVAGSHGEPVEWIPVQIVKVEPDLPDFVEHFSFNSYKGTLRATVRMETPVIYFYSPRETKVSIQVFFCKGLITEWFPHATHFQPSAPLSQDTLYETHEDGGIAWDSVTITPGFNASLPKGIVPNHYYAARETSATPLAVQTYSGDQHEKFLFYRGVSNASVPITAKVLPSGSIQFDSRTSQPIPALILFERRGDKLGYRLVTSPLSGAILETPSVSGTFDSLRGDLEDLLVAQGLFRDEAHAMLETWRDSWFEEGSRLFYIVPRAYVDSILPLSIHPAPNQLVRVFVGRMELVTPATERSIETALASHDGAALGKYDRFLNPILSIMSEKQTDPARAERVMDDLLSSH